MLRAAIFDWDGVVIDSAAEHKLSWEKLASEENLPLPEGHFEKGFGKVNRVIIPDILGWTHDPAEVKRLGERKEALYRESLRENGIEPLPGVRELLEDLRAHAIPCAIGSSTPRNNLDCALEILGLADYFSAIVSGDDVEHGKPHPEVFLKCAQALGADPAHCVVFEDSFHGLEAARAGGMKKVAVATTHPEDELFGERIVHRLCDLPGTAALQALWS